MVVFGSLIFCNCSKLMSALHKSSGFRLQSSSVVFGFSQEFVRNRRILLEASICSPTKTESDISSIFGAASIWLMVRSKSFWSV